MKRVRHVKTVVQHYFVIDDGDTLEEATTDPVTVSAAHWADYPQGAFAESVASLQEQVNASG